MRDGRRRRLSIQELLAIRREVGRRVSANGSGEKAEPFFITGRNP